MKHIFITALFICITVSVSAQTRKCGKCGQAIPYAKVTDHHKTCKPKPLTPTTKVCAQCRQGKALSSFSGSNDINAVAWYNGNSGKTTHPVGQKQPNELGLYDMSGNVWERCQDWFGKYNRGAQTNPKGPSNASHRVYRGGGWNNFAGGCRASYRGNGSPGYRYLNVGLRLAL